MNKLTLLVICNFYILCAFASENVIRIKGDWDFPPYEYLNDKGEPNGFMIDFTNELMEIMNISYNMELSSWSLVLEELENNNIDLVQSMVYEDTYADKYYFSKNNLITSYINIVTRIKEPLSIEDLEGLKIIAQRGSGTTNCLQKFNYDDNIIWVDNSANGLKMLNESKGDVVLCLNDVAKYLIRTNNYEGFKLYDINQPEFDFRYASKDSALINKVDLAIETLMRNGTYDKLYYKWFLDEKNESETDMYIYTMLLFSIIIALILCVVIVFFMKKVRIVSAKNNELWGHFSLALDAGKLAAWIYKIEKDDFILLKGNALNNGRMTSDEFNSFIHPDDKRILWDSINSIIQEKVSKDLIEFRLKIGDEDYRWYQCSLMIINPKRSERFIIGTRKDITDEMNERLKLVNSNKELIAVNKEIKTKENYLKEILDKLPVPICIKDHVNDVFLYQNEESNQLFGNLINKNTRDLFLEEDSDKMRKIDQNIYETGEEYSSTQFLRLSDGRSIYANVRKICLEINNKKEILISCVDLTEQKRLMKELCEAKEKAEESDKLKSNFLANMSHEIRTPLNAIVGFSELMQNSDNQADRDEYMKVIGTNNDMLLRLIDDILDLSKIESDMLIVKPEIFNLSEMFDEVYTMFKKRIQNTSLELIYNSRYERLLIKSDKNRVRQILINYISNAIKYTPKGRIEMGFELYNEGIRINVKDTGIGIPKERQKLVFQRFEKFDTFAQGSGLGLSICKATAILLGGIVGFESKEGEGSEFWVWLPLNNDKSENSRFETKILLRNNIENISVNLPKLKILVAEDIDSNYQLMKIILKEHEVKRVINGEYAITEALNNNYDFILMDMKMPVMDGIEATKSIRKFNNTIPIIAVTANAFDSDRSEAIKSGCNDFITKPLKKHDVINILNKYFVK